jgi:general secretion pathway protein C
MAAFFALSLMVSTLAHWTWRLLLPPLPAPPPARPSVQPADVLARRLAASPLLGGAAPRGGQGAQGTVGSNPSIAVTGVYASIDGRQGFAILHIDGQTQAVRVGQILAPGLVLAGVYADHIELLQDGTRLRLGLATAQAAHAAPQTVSGQLKIESRGRGRFALSRASFQEASKDPASYIAFGRFGLHPRGGAVLLDSPAGGMAERLGLLPGDIITHIDGKPLRTAEDAAQIFQRIVTHERVQLDLRRGETRFALTIDILP